MATNAQVDGEACCAQRATIVPAVALCVDIGLPLTLLLVAYIYLRRKGSPGACISPQTTLPLIQVHEQENVSVLDLSATLPVPAERGRSRLPSIMLSVMSSVSLKLFETAAEQPATVRDRAHEIETRLVDLAVEQEELVMQELCTDRRGLTASEAASRLLRNGPAFYKQTNGPSLLQMIWNAVMQPFNGLMAAVAVLTICPPTNDTRTFTLIMILLIGAILLRFREEVKSTRTARSLLADFSAQTTVLRDGRGVKVDSNETVVGDIVKLSGNDIVPADLRILNSHDLLIGMASLTGEATPVQKSATCPNRSINILDAANVAFQGTNVISGTATGVVLATGKDTYAGHIATSMSCSRQLNAFDFAVRRVVYLFIWFLVFMVPVVIVLSGISTGSWSGAVALGLSVAVGLSPQMMPMIITANLSRGAEQMRRHDAIVKRLDAVQNMGSMSVLCTDKTGTLTQEKLLLTQHLNADGEMSEEVLHLAFLNSVMQEASENPVDQAISTFGMDLGLVCGSKTFKVREIPFDFQRRMSSVIYSEQEDLRLVCKGAVEDVMPRCDRILTQNLTVRLDEAWIDTLTERCALLNGQGLKVLAVAQKTLKGVTTDSSRLDETGLVFCGYIVFLDPPKASVEPTVKTLKGLGVTIKVLTGDSLLVAKRLCEDVGIAVHSQITGSQLANMSASEVEDAVLRTTIFARVTPRQKLMIIATLQKQEHICGYLGDGTNDTLALQKADVGICVHSGTDAAKNAADLILLGEDLASISEGVRLGRVTYGNTIKYIKFAASSSFGNTFSILAGAAWLPFNPLLPIQVLALNLLYNISQLAIPWDSMDEEFLKKPRRWSAKFLGLYMLIIGPTSSIFDMITFLISWYVFKANNSSTTAAGTFTSIWFLESLMTQTFIVHLLRTERLPFIQSRASWPLMVSSFGTMAVGAVLCFIPQVNQTLQLRKPPNLYYAYLIGTVAVYSVTVQCFKGLKAIGTFFPKSWRGLRFYLMDYVYLTGVWNAVQQLPLICLRESFLARSEQWATKVE